MSDWQLIHGEALQALTAMTEPVDAVICDPPYSSGGFTRNEKNRTPDQKYTQSGSAQGKRPDFGGDSRDQRSYLLWCSLWIEECMRLLRPGGYFLAFTDWRQLPVMTDAVQAGGVFWRGLVVWDKGAGARAPHKGYFKHQCEYVVWGTKGPATVAGHDGPFPGCVQATVRQVDKHHLTGKPTALMEELVRCVPPGGLILDPFAGSGTTGVAALKTGRRFIGIEREAAYAAIAEERLRGVARDSERQIELFIGGKHETGVSGERLH